MQSLSSLPSPPLPAGMQECSPTTANNTYLVLDNSANSLLLQQAQIPNALSQVHNFSFFPICKYKKTLFM